MSKRLTRVQLRRLILKEALTKTDIEEIKRIARKEAKEEIIKVVGKDLDKTIQKEVEKVFKDKATKEEIGEITKQVIKKMYKEISLTQPQILKRIKVT